MSKADRQINQKRWKVSNLKHPVKLYTGKARHKNVPLSWTEVTGTIGTMNTWGTSTSQHWGNYTINTGGPILFWSLLPEQLLSTYFTTHAVHSVQIYWQSPTCWAASRAGTGDETKMRWFLPSGSSEIRMSRTTRCNGTNTALSTPNSSPPILVVFLFFLTSKARCLSPNSIHTWIVCMHVHAVCIYTHT